MRTKSELFADQIRKSSLEMVTTAKAAHIGSNLSIADLVAVLYCDILNIDPTEPLKEDRDRFILSKGHACAIIYAALAEKGFFNKNLLKTFGEANSILMSHISHKVPGVEFSTGSLGHGLPFGVGKALGAKIQRKKWRTYVILGDGELDEGSNWEALLFASHHKLHNLVTIVDYNNLQSFTTLDETLNMKPLEEKFLSFGCSVLTIDGHDHDQISNALKLRDSEEKPLVVIAKTIKGKGVSFMENRNEWHYRSPNLQQLEEAISEVMLRK